MEGRRLAEVIKRSAYETYSREIFRLARHERIAILRDIASSFEKKAGEEEEKEERFRGYVERIERGGDLEEVKGSAEELKRFLMEDFKEDPSVKKLHYYTFISGDALSSKVIEMVQDEMVEEGYGPIPCRRWCWVACGSEGRRERSFDSDQDNLVVFEITDEDREKSEYLKENKEILRRKLMDKGEGDLTIDDFIDGYFQIFSEKVSEKLDSCGVRKCKGGIMPMNEKWRGDIRDWERRVVEKMRFGRGPLTLLDILIITDSRPVYGYIPLGKRFSEFVQSFTHTSVETLREIARSSLLTPVAIGLFKRFRVERSGPHKGKFNLKINGWAPLIMVARLFSLKLGLMHTGTLGRIRALRDRGVLTEEESEELEDAYYTLMKIRLMMQIRAIEQGETFDNYVNPDELDPEEREKLRKALISVERFQNKAYNAFNIGGFI